MDRKSDMPCYVVFTPIGHCVFGVGWGGVGGMVLCIPQWREGMHKPLQYPAPPLYKLRQSPKLIRSLRLL